MWARYVTHVERQHVAHRGGLTRWRSSFNTPFCRTSVAERTFFFFFGFPVWRSRRVSGRDGCADDAPFHENAKRDAHSACRTFSHRHALPEEGTTILPSDRRSFAERTKSKVAYPLQLLKRLDWVQQVVMSHKEQKVQKFCVAKKPSLLLGVALDCCVVRGVQLV